MTDAASFTKFVPGFDFLQNLMKTAGSSLPVVGQWVTPTLNPEELEKRINDLRTVQFWLEQNARMLSTTIQALEVQRMTLSTLKTMNVQMGDLRDALRVPMPGEAAASASAPSAPTTTAGTTASSTAAPAASEAAAKAAPAAGAVDPMQWWGALTQQFTELATAAVKDTATEAAKTFASNVVKTGVSAAGKSIKKAVSAPAKSIARRPAAKARARSAGK